MKSKLIIFAVALAAAAVANASTIPCTPPNQNVISNATAVLGATETCGPATISAAGNVITGVSFTLLVSWQDSAIPGTPHQITATITQPVGSPVTLSPFSVTTALSGTSQDNSIGFGIGTSGIGTVAPGTTSLSAIVLAVSVGTAGGFTLPDNASVTVNMNVFETSTQTGTPEPASLILFGSGFLALGLVARARKNKKKIG